MTASGGDVHDDEEDLHQQDAAVHLGMSPVAFASLLDRGVLPSYVGADGRHRRVTLAALEAHRESRFALRQELAAQARNRRRGLAGPGADTADVVIVA